MRGPSPLYIEERHRALGRDATFSWSRALTHPPRCNRTRHRGRHLGVVGAAILVSWGPPSWIWRRGGRHLGSEVVGAAILDLTSWRHLPYSATHTTCVYSYFWVTSWIFESEMRKVLLFHFAPCTVSFCPVHGAKWYSWPHILNAWFQALMFIYACFSFS